MFILLVQSKHVIHFYYIDWMDYSVSFFENFHIVLDESETCDACSYISIDPDTILYEGDLLECKQDSECELCHCILTKESLISTTFKAKDAEESLENKRISVINLDWPEMKKIHDKNCSGFTLKTHKSRSFTFLFNTTDDAIGWYKALSQICVQQDIMLDYEFITILGKGGSAIVWKAINKLTQEFVAIKCYNKAKLYEKAQPFVFFCTKNIQKELLLNEIEALHTLEHPNIIKFYGVYESYSLIYLVTEYAKGQNLHSLLKNIKTISESSASQILAEILESIDYCHKSGIVHSDIKPSNIIVQYFLFFVILIRKKEGKQRIKLIDFGSARFKDDSIRNVNGTIGYFAPEALETGQIDEKTDIYSCGIVLYYMLCGKIPFKGKNEDELLLKNRRNIIDYDYLTKRGVSRKMIEYIRKLTQANPEKRSSTSIALRDLSIN